MGVCRGARLQLANNSRHADTGHPSVFVVPAREPAWRPVASPSSRYPLDPAALPQIIPHSLGPRAFLSATIRTSTNNALSGASVVAINRNRQRSPESAPTRQKMRFVSLLVCVIAASSQQQVPVPVGRPLPSCSRMPQLWKASLQVQSTALALRRPEASVAQQIVQGDQGGGSVLCRVRPCGSSAEIRGLCRGERPGGAEKRQPGTCCKLDAPPAPRANKRDDRKDWTGQERRLTAAWSLATRKSSAPLDKFVGHESELIALAD
jgi:hypothetical protein